MGIRMKIRTILLMSIGLAACGESGPTEPEVSVTQTFTVNASAAWKYVSLVTGTASEITTTDATASTAWDIGFFTTSVKLNGGLAGYCVCRTAKDTTALKTMTAANQAAAFDAVTAADIPSDASFKADVFDTNRWYRYNITGSDNQIWPTFDVYLLKRGTQVLKVQLVNYYNANGEPRHITVRYAKLHD